MVGHDKVQRILEILRIATKVMVKPASQEIVSRYGRDPFLVLISCLLSLRTRDTVSLPASLRLFEHARKPEEILALSLAQIEKLIFPCGFYHQKARTLHRVSYDIIHVFSGEVPNTREQLMLLPGVGPKTANLVLVEGFGIPALIVDTHVHRISNRLGVIQTKTPEETEQALMRVIPKENWIEWSHMLVMWGQNICVPISPFCSRCPLFDICERKGVTRRR